MRYQKFDPALHNAVMHVDDEELGELCTVNLDMDDYSDFIEGRTGYCPYYRRNDEYATVRKQN